MKNLSTLIFAGLIALGNCGRRNKDKEFKGIIKTKYQIIDFGIVKTFYGIKNNDTLFYFYDEPNIKPVEHDGEINYVNFPVEEILQYDDSVKVKYWEGSFKTDYPTDTSSEKSVIFMAKKIEKL